MGVTPKGRKSSCCRRIRLQNSVPEAAQGATVAGQPPRLTDSMPACVEGYYAHLRIQRLNQHLHWAIQQNSTRDGKSLAVGCDCSMQRCLRCCLTDSYRFSRVSKVIHIILEMTANHLVFLNQWRVHFPLIIAIEIV